MTIEIEEVTFEHPSGQIAHYFQLVAVAPMGARSVFMERTFPTREEAVAYLESRAN